MASQLLITTVLEEAQMSVNSDLIVLNSHLIKFEFQFHLSM